MIPARWDEYEWDAGVGTFRVELDEDGCATEVVGATTQPAHPRHLGWSAERALVECSRVGVPLDRPVAIVDGRRAHP